MSTDIISLTDFKNDASGWIERLQSQAQVVLTQNGRGRAVVQSYESWQQQRFALALLKRVLQGQADASAGRTVPHQQVEADVLALIDDVAARKASNRAELSVAEPPAKGVAATRGVGSRKPKMAEAVRRRRG